MGGGGVERQTNKDKRKLKDKRCTITENSGQPSRA